MIVKTLSLGILGTNCYIISKDKQSLIFDPGGEPEIISAYLQENNLTPAAILLTHAHYDHIGAVDVLRKQYELDVYLHEEEADWLVNPALNRSLMHLGDEGAYITEKPDKILQVGDYELAGFNFSVVHTPGHSPGSVTFIFEDEEILVSGDVLFHQGIGRTDLPQGSIEQLANSIVTELYTLPDSFRVYPGHGTDTTIGLEKRINPYTLQFYDK